MNLREREILQGKYAEGYRFIARDEDTSILYAYVEKPIYIKEKLHWEDISEVNDIFSCIYIREKDIKISITDTKKYYSLLDLLENEDEDIQTIEIYAGNIGAMQSKMRSKIKEGYNIASLSILNSRDDSYFRAIVVYEKRVNS